MIKLSHLRKVFVREKIETIALNDVSLQIAAGEFVAIMGPSGCGKSTLLNILGMLDAPSSGQYWLEGTEVFTGAERELVERRNRDIGFVFQSFNLLESPTVFENVELPLIYRKLPKAQRRTLVNEVLERLNLDRYAAFHPTELSGGEQQRVAVARAVVGAPKLILADEPTGNLDSKNAAAVMNLLGVLNMRGASICMVTHSPDCADRAHRIINMLDGRIVMPEQIGIGEPASCSTII